MIPIRDFNPTTRQPYVTIVLIVICVLAYSWQASLDSRTGELVVRTFGFIPARLFQPTVLEDSQALLWAISTLVTSMFLHGSIMHLAGNMLYLWIFGNNIEDVCGHGRFLAFYLLCGMIAAMAQALPNANAAIPMIGASGAISGVLGAYLMLFPKAQVQVIIPIGFFIIRTISAGWLLGIWIGFQVISGLAADNATSGVAWWAHVGGFVAGLVLIPLFRQRTSEPEMAGFLGRSPGTWTSSRRAGRSRIPDSRAERPSDPPPPPSVVKRRHR